MINILIWVSLIIAGFGMMIIASEKIIRHVSMLAHGLSIPPFILGITLVAVGTDLPEIANSIMSSVAGHGDLNVGDSVGSIMTQITLVLGILPLVGGAFNIMRGQIMLISILTIAALGISSFLFVDGDFSRYDGIILCLTWIIFTSIAINFSTYLSEPVLQANKSSKLYHAFVSILFLFLLLAGAGTAVKGIVEIAELAKIPKFIISFFGASFGTSMPELVVNIVAIRNGKKGLALGDILGSCMVDASLAIGIGPVIAPTLVTAALAVKGTIITMIVVLVATGLIALRRKHDYLTGVALLILYGLVYYFILAH